ncbi:MAG: hypothetical protein ACKO2L_05480 [Planctomycetaceae bacterium]
MIRKARSMSCTWQGQFEGPFSAEERTPGKSTAVIQNVLASAAMLAAMACFADFRLTGCKVCWSLAMAERLSSMSNHRKRVNYSGEKQVAILRAHFVEGLVQKNEVIAKLLQEHVQLKKANGDP